MGNILLIGLDEDLLQTRSAVLRETHANVTARRGTELGDLREQHFDLAVFCSSLPAYQRQALADEVRRLWPEARIIQVSETRRPDPGIATHADGITGWGRPDDLVDVAAKLIREKHSGRGSSSAA
jgi:hypothetical protein